MGFHLAEDRRLYQPTWSDTKTEYAVSYLMLADFLAIARDAVAWSPSLIGERT